MKAIGARRTTTTTKKKQHEQNAKNAERSKHSLALYHHHHHHRRSRTTHTLNHHRPSIYSIGGCVVRGVRAHTYNTRPASTSNAQNRQCKNHDVHPMKLYFFVFFFLFCSFLHPFYIKVILMCVNILCEKCCVQVQHYACTRRRSAHSVSRQ